MKIPLFGFWEVEIRIRRVQPWWKKLFKRPAFLK